MAETLTIAARVRDNIAYVLGKPVECVTDEASLADDLGSDSLDIVELAIKLETSFQIEITDDDMDTWRTAGDVIRTVERKR